MESTDDPYLELAWLENQRPNDSNLVGRRCKLACWHSKCWPQWQAWGGRVPVGDIARDLEVSGANRITNLFSGKMLLSDESLEKIAQKTQAHIAWLLSGRYAPKWFSTYQEVIYGTTGPTPKQKELIAGFSRRHHAPAEGTLSLSLKRSDWSLVISMLAYTKALEPLGGKRISQELRKQFTDSYFTEPEEVLPRKKRRK
jgi:hypothetical protein